MKLDATERTEEEEVEVEDSADELFEGEEEEEKENEQGPPKEAHDGDTIVEPTDEAMVDFLEQLQKMRGKIRQLEAKYEIAKDEAADFRKRLETANRELGQAIDKGPERLPLFDKSAPETAVETPEPAAPEPVKEGEEWRNVTLEELGLPPGICLKLRESNGIRTLGQIADYASNNDGLRGLVGIGEAKAHKIQEACDKYWAEQPD